MAESADAAYTEVGNAALAAGATQQEAEALASAAWQTHYDEKKEMRVREMAYEAAFSAALTAILAGNAEGATAIAKAAFFTTRDAAMAAFGAIEEADISMRAGLTDTREADLANTIMSNDARVESAAEVTDAMTLGSADQAGSSSQAATDAETAWAASHTAQTVTSNTMTDEAIANSLRLKDAVVADTVEMLAGWTTMVDGMQVEHTTASGAMRDSWTETVTGMQDQAGIGFNAIGAAWAQVTMDMQWDALRAAQGINTALSTIRDRTVTITTVHRTVRAPLAGARAFGGPVTGGLSYLVGERGPERFTPNVSGYVSPGAGRGGGGPQPIIIKNTVHLSRREVTTAVAEDVFREVRRRVGG